MGPQRCAPDTAVPPVPAFKLIMDQRVFQNRVLWHISAHLDSTQFAYEVKQMLINHYS